METNNTLVKEGIRFLSSLSVDQYFFYRDFFYFMSRPIGERLIHFQNSEISDAEKEFNREMIEQEFQKFKRKIIEYEQSFVFTSSNE